jgi:hypothetical protein
MGSTDMLPVVIAIVRGVPGGLDERLKQNWRAANHVPKNPRHDDDHVPLRTRGGACLKPQAWLGLLCEQIPSLEFDTQENLVR